MRAILPLLLIISAIGIFVFYTDPQYQSSKALSVQVATYDNALNKSQELRKLRDELLSRRNTFSPEDLSRLQEFLPENVDNIRLIIDINNIAARRNLPIANVSVSGTAGPAGKAATVGANADTVGSVTATFTITATYDEFLTFLADLEHSLRAIDVQHVSFGTAASNDPKATPGASDFSFTIRTYWLQ